MSTKKPKRAVPLEKEVQASIVKALEEAGFLVWRSNAGAIFTGKRAILLAPDGHPDLSLIIHGRACFLEVKRPTRSAKTSDVQEARHELMRDHGALIAVVKSAEEALQIATAWRSTLR